MPVVHSTLADSDLAERVKWPSRPLRQMVDFQEKLHIAPEWMQACFCRRLKFSTQLLDVQTKRDSYIHLGCFLMHYGPPGETNQRLRGIRSVYRIVELPMSEVDTSSLATRL